MSDWTSPIDPNAKCATGHQDAVILTGRMFCADCRTEVKSQRSELPGKPEPWDIDCPRCGGLLTIYFWKQDRPTEYVVTWCPSEDCKDKSPIAITRSGNVVTAEPYVRTKP